MEQVKVLYHLVVMVTCLVCLGSNVGMCSRSDPVIKTYVSSSLPSNDGLVYLVRKISESEWDSLVIRSEVPVMVAFKSDWCDGCSDLNYTINILEEKYNNKFKFYIVDFDEEYALTVKNNIDCNPTTLIFKGGKEEARVAGYEPYKLEDLINEIM